MNILHRLRSLFLVALVGLASRPAVASVVLPREIEVRCGVLFTLQAQQNYGMWSSQVPQYFQGGDWTHLLLFGYMPFALVENKTNTTVLLQGTSSNQPPTLEFSQPPLAIRLKRVGASPSGYITTGPITLTQIYASGASSPKKYGMRLYGTVDGSGTGSGSVVLGPGQSMMLTKWFDPNELFSDTGSFFDWRNNLTQSFVATPGFQGAAQAFCCDFLTGGTGNLTAGINGQLKSAVVVGSRLADAWDIEMSPAPGSTPGQIQLYPATNLPSDWRNCFPDDSRVTSFPFKLTDHIAATPASQMCSYGTTPMKNRIVQPIALAKVDLDNLAMVTTPDPTADTDHDGMDNAWESAVFGQTETSPDDDPDHDGYSNLFEFLAGTSPIASNGSILQSPAPIGQSSYRLTWSSVPGRTYRIETSQDLITWQMITTVKGAATPATTTQYTVPKNGANRYYRLQIVSPY